MSRRTRMMNKLSHPSRRRALWQRVKRGGKVPPGMPAVEWRFRDWEYRQGRLP